MPRVETEPLRRVHIWLYADDADWLRTFFSESTKQSKAVREMVRKFRRQIEATADKTARPMELPDVGSIIPESFGPDAE